MIPVTCISKNALIPYSAAEMYALVDDIASYPGFLEWCRSATELERSGDQVTARLELARGAFHKTFTTRNRMQQDKMVEMRLVEGPFRLLEGFWRFDSLGERACKVSFDLEFEFSSRLMGLAAGPAFSQIANTMVDAFCKRAVEIYGKN